MSIWITDTSVGRVAIQFEYVTKSVGTIVTLYRVDDGGWATAAGTWPRHGEDARLPEKMAEVFDLPPDEAARIADEGFELFRQRHGERSDMSRRDWVTAGSLLTVGFGAIALALLALLTGLVLLVLHLT